MSNCSVCGKSDANIVCDNSCGTNFCSDECCMKDSHECSDCPKCVSGVVHKQNNGLWKCDTCNFQTQNVQDLDIEDEF